MLDAPRPSPHLQGKKGGSKDAQGKEESDIYKIVRMIAERNFDPCIVFSFSKKECEALAQQVGACAALPALRCLRSAVLCCAVSSKGVGALVQESHAVLFCAVLRCAA